MLDVSLDSPVLDSVAMYSSSSSGPPPAARFSDVVVVDEVCEA